MRSCSWTCNIVEHQMRNMCEINSVIILLEASIKFGNNEYRFIIGSRLNDWESTCQKNLFTSGIRSVSWLFLLFCTPLWSYLPSVLKSEALMSCQFAMTVVALLQNWWQNTDFPSNALVLSWTEWKFVSVTVVSPNSLTWKIDVDIIFVSVTLIVS